MPTNEKEINNILFDQLTILERLEEAHKNGFFEAEAGRIRKEIERKLYQKPPLED
ncbi:MAG: hypothetical protein IJ058_01255 [Lachnospiraceae bacterium]|nr:hypothetical protein [Lachnospiraceae bacterium]